MKRYVFDPRLFDGPALFDTTYHHWRDLLILVTVMPSGWKARLACGQWAAGTWRQAWDADVEPSGWRSGTHPSGWSAAVRRDEL